MDPKKLTSTHRHSFGDRKVHLFKTPSIPLRRGKRVIKNKLEFNHHNYNSTAITVVHKDYRSFVISNKSVHHSTSSKSVNKRKRYKRSRKFRTRHLIVTPASKLLLSISNISKRPRDVCDSVYNPKHPKQRRLEAGTFQIEPIDDVAKKLFAIDTDMPHNINVPDQNENLLSVASKFSDYTKKVYSTVQSSPSILTQNMNMLNECRHAELRLRKIVSTIDEKFTISIPKKVEDYEASALCGKETPYGPSKEEVFELWKQSTVDVKDIKPAVVVVKTETETEADEIRADRSDELPSSVVQSYPGQLVWARYQRYPYWPAIVCVPDTEATKGKIEVKFFADKGTGGVIKKENVVDFQGIDSFVRYKEAMMSKLSRSDWKAWFTVTKKAKAWAKAVVEITFILSRDLDTRLALFDIIVICTLRDTIRNPPSLSQLISEHASPSQLEHVNRMFADNPNIFEDVKQNLTEISSVIEAESLARLIPAVASSHKPQTPVPTLAKKSLPNPQQRRLSLPAHLTKRRTSTRLATVVKTSPNKLSTSLPIEPQQKSKEKATDPSKSKEEKRIEFEKALEWYTNVARQKESLFKGLRRGNVCKECLVVDENLDRDLVKCSGNCFDHVHRKCAHFTTASDDVRCLECSDASSRVCYACKEKCTESAVRCSFKTCGRYYHSSCLAEWFQTRRIEPDKVMCPTHICHTCVSDDPKNMHFPLSIDSKLSRCIKCPTTFHADSNCIPAGVEILTANQNICIRHRRETRNPLNLNWCYLCGEAGGGFLCCESCPLTSHFACLNIPSEPEHYVCDGCETGRHPLHGEVVWSKYSNYRWWPAVIVPPACIPSSMNDKVRNQHEMCVRFFGTYEFGWIGRSFVFLFSEGDLERHNETKSYEAAVQAEKWYKSVTIKGKISTKIKPLPYTKIGKNKELAPAKLTRSKRCDPDPCSCSPDDADPCGPTSNCEKREAWTECIANLCPTGDKCRNQSIGKRKYASFRLQYFGDKGFGLVADTFICEGTMVVEYVGELVTETEFQSRLKTKQTLNSYFMRYGKGLYIDAEKKGNLSRFINHSCNPNCQPRVIEVKGFERIGLIAMKNIEKGEELTFNYEFDEKTHQCFCGEAKCRGFI